MPQSFVGKVAVVTGASSGIGQGAAVELASLGAKVVLAGRDEKALGDTVAQCLARGAKEADLLVVAGDVTKAEDRAALVRTAVGTFGALDVLVNSAGSIVSGNVETAPLSDLDWIMDLNVRSLVALTQLAIPHIKASKGAIVNVSSVTGPCSFPGVTFYCMSKAAVDQFTKCLALELAGDGVRVNAVNPGVIVTNLHKRGGMDEAKYAAFLQHSAETHALGRPGTVEETAKAIAFLASSDASFTTGQLLKVDGGRGIMSPR